MPIRLAQVCNPWAKCNCEVIYDCECVLSVLSIENTEKYVVVCTLKVIFT